MKCCQKWAVPVDADTSISLHSIVFEEKHAELFSILLPTNVPYKLFWISIMDELSSQYYATAIHLNSCK